MSYSINETVDSIFDGRDYWVKPEFSKVQLGEISDMPKRKEYKLKRNQLKVLNTKAGRENMATNALDSVFSYIRTQDVYQDAFRVLSYRFDSGYTYINFEAYVAN